MSRITFRSIALLLIVWGVATALSGQAAKVGAMDSAKSKLETVPVTLGGKTVFASHANEDWSRTEGLLKWSTITEDEGMLLDFKLPGQHAIHMQGMKFPIDAVWIDAQGVIKLIYEEIPPNSGQVYPSLFSCRYCLELKSGFCKKYGVKIGQTLTFGGGQR
ncbi:MAG TPA: DUF192 domain-containing protein [Desulfomonilaceae bacterium]|nr:DUF192 domain-containing protein [Desulfomonilaceae bacterium]